MRFSSRARRVLRGCGVRSDGRTRVPLRGFPRDAGDPRAAEGRAARHRPSRVSRAPGDLVAAMEEKAAAIREGRTAALGDIDARIQELRRRQEELQEKMALGRVDTPSTPPPHSRAASSTNSRRRAPPAPRLTGAAPHPRGNRGATTPRRGLTRRRGFDIIKLLAAAAADGLRDIRSESAMALTEQQRDILKLMRSTAESYQTLSIGSAHGLQRPARTISRPRSISSRPSRRSGAAAATRFTRSPSGCRPSSTRWRRGRARNGPLRRPEGDRPRGSPRAVAGTGPRVERQGRCRGAETSRQKTRVEERRDLLIAVPAVPPR